MVLLLLELLATAPFYRFKVTECKSQDMRRNMSLVRAVLVTYDKYAPSDGAPASRTACNCAVLPFLKLPSANLKIYGAILRQVAFF